MPFITRPVLTGPETGGPAKFCARGGNAELCTFVLNHPSTASTPQRTREMIFFTLIQLCYLLPNEEICLMTFRN